MPNTIERVERKRPSDGIFRQDLQRSGPGTERSGQARALDVPAHQRSDQVRGAEDVETSRQDGASDAVQDRWVPGYLRLVD